MSGLGLRVQDLGFKVQGVGLRVYSWEFRIYSRISLRFNISKTVWNKNILGKTLYGESRDDYYS